MSYYWRREAFNSCGAEIKTTMARKQRAFKLQEALDRDSTVTEFIKETDNCAISMFSENSSMQMGSRGGALKSVTNQPTSKGNLRAEREPHLSHQLFHFCCCCFTSA